ncbi:MAG: hypothetical protein NVSMB15_13710 [Steroidobacteraceae bacterium]
MRIFKRGAVQTTPVVKNVSVTELLVRRDAGQGIDSEIPKTVPNQRKETAGKPGAAGTDAPEHLRGSTL